MLPPGGGLTATAFSLQAPRTPTAFAGGVGLTLLVTFLLSKQAFMNYYFFVSGALLIAAAAWPTSQEPASPELDHLPCRAEETTKKVTPKAT